MAKLTKPQRALLEAVVTATVNQEVAEAERFTYVKLNHKPTEKLLLLKFVVVNTDITNDDGEVACRATPEGVAEVSDEDVAEAPVTPQPPEPIEETQPELIPAEEPEKPTEKPSFEIESGVEIPKLKRGGRGRSLYPFEQMGVGDSFHVASTEEKPNPAKNLASTVSSANKRAREAGVNDRKFIVRRVDENDPKGDGARVFCIAVESE